jgi:MtN3 and saliva related transmembrane protein
MVLNHLDVLATIANILGIIYNLPQMYKTFKRKTTQDISFWFLSLRLLTSIIWVYYFSYLQDIQLIVANFVPLLASAFVGYYKIKEMINDYKIEKDDKLNIVFTDLTNGAD